MKIGSQSQTLVSLHSLLDASKQQQEISSDGQAPKKVEVEKSRDGRLLARKEEREELIQQNRNALTKIQDDLRLKNIESLKSSDETEEGTSSKSLNLRERAPSTGAAAGQPAFEKLGQIIDISI